MPQPPKQPSPQNYLRYLSLGSELVGTMGICIGIGYALDEYFQPSKPWGILGFAILGCMVLMWRIIRIGLRP